MKQKVHSVSYLAKAEFEFKNGVYDLVALPSGAEVVKVSLEVVGTPSVGSVSVGFKDETTKNYFLTLENIATSNAADKKHATSAKDYTATSNKVVVAEVKNANKNDTKGVLRVLYFLPSVIEVEY
uniref:Phage protein n=1 Tax=Helicobacter pylori TaxID=210 RepID=A0A060CU24_HELPX|nr:phage protein [Helicobacter pylori]